MPDTYRFEGRLLPADTATYITHTFSLPPRTGILRLRLRYAPYRVGALRNVISLGLFDPQGFRGQAHRGPPDAEVVVSPAMATPGFLPGPLPAGTWQAQLAVHAVIAEAAPCQYSLEVESEQGDPPPAPDASQPTPPQARSRKQGWYRGELHIHTKHSDGAFSVAEIVDRAQRRGLDFIAITDHNTVSGWREIGALSDTMLIIPGLELTTFHGHAVALGVDRWVDWRTGHQGWTMADAAKAVRAAGGLFIIAHPWNVGTPLCTGCRWEYDDMDMDLVDGMELWNGAWDRPGANNERNLDLWRRVQQRRPLVGVAAADFHSDVHWSPNVPVTYVYAQELSVGGIMEGLRRSRVVVTTGPWLELRATGKRWALMEDVLVSGPVNTNLLATWRDAPPGARLRWLEGSTLLGQQTIAEQGAMHIAAPGGRVHLEMWSADNKLLAVTNPVAAT